MPDAGCLPGPPRPSPTCRLRAGNYRERRTSPGPTRRRLAPKSPDNSLGRAILEPVSFFDDLPEPPPPPEPRHFEPKPWMGPLPGWVGGWVPWHVELVRKAYAYAALTDVTAFPTGVEFTLDIRFRLGTVFARHDPLRGPTPLFDFGRSDGPQFGIGFADGRKANIIGDIRLALAQREPDRPVLFPRGGSGSGDEHRMGVWLWPLPPAGPLTVVLGWASRGLGERARASTSGSPLSASRTARPSGSDFR